MISKLLFLRNTWRSMALLLIALPATSEDSLTEPDELMGIIQMATLAEERHTVVEASIDELNSAVKEGSPRRMARLAGGATGDTGCSIEWHLWDPKSRTLSNAQRKQQESLQNQATDLLGSRAQAKWARLAEKVTELAVSVRDVEVVCEVMDSPVSAVGAQIHQLALTLKGNLKYKTQLREKIAEIRDTIVADAWPAEVTYIDESGVERTVVLDSKEQAEQLEDNLNQQLQTAADATQMMQMQLRDAMRNQRLVMQALSAILKSTHEALLAIAKKIGR